ncbi:glycosyltransferase family 2 protein [Oricola sp.]|uniref:glycosyltransferase family 2 protein n=1 Tax=Oricola sp. TaxID=1979950 RepID=UPI0025E056BF|nr:glycosyltransferase family 2 protein [Oricola sp.]MCI5075106.1 glycosyltransferase family 2 protein [Oricola sp.]
MVPAYPHRVSVIISTYNAPHWLENSLEGFDCQESGEFEIVIADDGSTAETRDVITRFAERSRIPVKHCWHEDDGFRKTIILNRAIEAAEGDYLIFTDGDCIPRKDFVSTHASGAGAGGFLSGGVEYLSKEASEGISAAMIREQQLFDPAWLAGRRERKRRFGKVNQNRVVQQMLRRFNPTAATFNGHNASAWKRDILAVNGFDERMAYGGLDRELGERLEHNGVRGRSVRYDAILVHQWHERPYATKASWGSNNRIRKVGKSQGARWTEWGIVSGQSDTQS